MKTKINKIIVEVSGGVVQNVYAESSEGIEVQVLDWDNVEAGDDARDMPEAIKTMKQVF